MMNTWRPGATAHPHAQRLRALGLWSRGATPRVASRCVHVSYIKTFMALFVCLDVCLVVFFTGRGEGGSTPPCDPPRMHNLLYFRGL